ncbi:unnamed protein product [Cladocopium goreaui]|uniref:PTI1-like tyrosine-protein kinase 2 n=1 Tax=Cladocopium goreaui TaxID=2562237 RepID=A0A9P1BPZ9_9DINO|nr:unnamed protein product [Cladocopium goreaui]
MQLFQQLGEALARLTSGQCAWNDLTKAELRNLSAELEEPKSAIEGLEGLALEYSWQELQQATESFAPTRQLGAGASGTVYYATLCEGTEAAIKVLDAPARGGFDEEVRLLSRCRHPNVVMLLGFAEETQFPFAPINRRCALVYEMLHGGDLYRRLRDEKPYQWQDRLRTATEVCRGLAHLHKHRPKIFHRDIKSQNILFSSDGTAKIADFGLACMANHHHEHEVATVQVAGTLGYSDPLYTRTGVISESSECYSFGQVLIELLVGRPPAVLAQDGHSCVFLSDELRPKEDRAKGRVLSRLDGRAQWPLQTAASMATLALLCIHDDADRRPSFLEATDMLRDLAVTPASPKQEPAETEHSRHSQDSHYEDKNSNQKAPDIARESRSGASGACSPPLPKWLELRSADVLQRLLREAQHSQHNQFSKHLQLEQVHQVHQVHLHQVLPSPRVHHIAQSPPCPPPHIHIQESRNHAMSPQCPAAASLAAHLATPGPQAQHPKQLQLWPTAPELQGAQPMQTPALFAQLPPARAKVQPLLEPQQPQQPQLRQHAKFMPEASQADTVKDLIEQLQQWPGSSIASTPGPEMQQGADGKPLDERTVPSL